MKTDRHTTARTAIGLACLILCPAANAAPAGAHCTLSTTGLGFGAYVPNANYPIDITATLQVVCTTTSSSPMTVQGTIVLSGGSGPASARRFAQGLRYQLYVDAGRTLAWADVNGAGGTASVTGFVNRDKVLRLVVPIYGRLLARQIWTPIGRYDDSVTATLNY